MSYFAGTRVIIEAEGFALACPRCDALVEEIQVHRVYETRHTCFECLEEFELCVTLSPT